MAEVLGVQLYDKGFSKAIDTLLEVALAAGKPNNFCVSATGAHGIIEAHKNNAFKITLQHFYLNLPDGMPGVWVGRLKGARQMGRCYGPDVFEEFMIRSAATGIRHFFCGGKEGVADALQLACSQRFGNHNISGTFSPPFREMSDSEMKELGQLINASGAQVVWIGLSTPKQELFASRLSGYTEVRLVITVGAVFDFFTGRVKQAPKWMQRSGLEWFFRLLVEPKRLYKRYFEVVPKFIWLNIKEFLHFCMAKKNNK
jgi:N-acetylglucosaminyldiphosphoundecaprenol N-acetyl-beta-D-mannosaminyltransferase